MSELATRARLACATFVTGVTIVTTTVDDVPYGLTVNAYSAVSYEPPTVTVGVTAKSATCRRLYESDYLAINILAQGQEALASLFGQSRVDKFATTEWTAGVTGTPLLIGTSAHLEARVIERFDAGGATVFICAVLEAETSGRVPLVYFNRAFHDGAALVNRD